MWPVKTNAGFLARALADEDFLSGEVNRAPLWMQRLRLEWSHRLLSDPKRLSGRYARNAWQLPQLLLKERFGRRVTRSVAGN